MKKLFLASALTIGSYCLCAQTEVKTWTRMVAGADYDYALAAATDRSGNVIFSGETHSFLGPRLFGKFDIFVTKYDASGNQQWLAQRGTGEQESAEGVATDSAGNVYVTGFTGGDLDGNVNAGAGHSDIFLMKFDPSGNWLWTIQDGTPQDDDAHAVAVDSADNVYITGYVKGDFHGNTRVGVADIFISKYDSSGSRLWSRLFGSDNTDDAGGIACDASNNVYVTGYTEGSVEGNSYLGNGDAILAKYDSNGNRKWLKQWGSVNADTGYAARCDGSGNVYVAGYTSGTLYGDKIGGPDIMLAKFDGSGNQLWGRKIGTTENDYAYGVAIDASGNAFIAGAASGSLQGNPYQGAEDAILAKYDSAGNLLWTTEIGTPNNDVATGVAVDSSGGVYIAGWSTGNFDGNTNQGQNDAFLVKYALPNSPPPAPTAHAATSITTIGFTANWDSATAATGYRLDVSTNSAFGTCLPNYTNLDVGNVLSRSVSGLSPGTIYYYRVRAYGTNGTGGNSATITVGTVIPFCTPGVLLNAGFEGGTNASGVANSWTTYSRATAPTTIVYVVQTNTPPPGGGLQYQQVGTSSSTGGAGVRQDITGCTIGATYTISGWMRGNSGSATCMVKVSPSASTVWSTAIDLSPPATYTGAAWTPFSGTVVATGTTMTIWLDGHTGGTGLFKAECFDSITVSCPPAFRIESISRLPQNQVSLVVSNAPYPSVAIRYSSDLSDWSLWTNVVPTDGTVRITDSSASNAVIRFYRATSP